MKEKTYKKKWGQNTCKARPEQYEKLLWEIRKLSGCVNDMYFSLSWQIHCLLSASFHVSSLQQLAFLVQLSSSLNVHLYID